METVRTWRRLSPRAVANALLPRPEPRAKAAPPAKRTTRQWQATLARENFGTRSPTRQKGRGRDRADQCEDEAIGLNMAEKLLEHLQ